LRANVEPNSDFKIQLDVRKTAGTAFQEIFRFDVDSGRFESLSPSRTGNYKISINTIRTSFRNNTSLESDVFQQFADNIPAIQQRFSAATGRSYETQSQDVLIPAFLAAYSGQSVNKVKLSPFPNIPVPGWRVDYSGLNKITALKEVFQSVTISHGYNASYSVLNYTNSLEYTDVDVNNPVENYNRSQFANQVNSKGELIPVYVINQVLITEQFQPLIGVNVRTKSRMNLRFEYKTKRDLGLNISNAQVTELNTRDWSLSIGYTKNNMKLPVKDQGRTITLKNDVTFRLDMSVTNNSTIQRKIDEVNTITNGNINFQLKPNVSYVVNQKLNIQMYLDRNINEPLVTNSFRRSNTRVGIKILFNLAQ
jgi:cell surface protein SprA